jgi:hypothetical protein
MSRYFSAPRARLRVDSEGMADDVPQGVNVTMPEHVATDTGLLDANGDPIMRAPRPIGFGRMEEWA